MSPLIRWICDPQLLEALEGDLAELYGDRRSWRYAWDVASLCLRRPRTAVRSLMAAIVALLLAGPVSGPGPLHYTVRGVDPAGQFTLEIQDGRVLGATLGGTPVRDHDLRQSGDTVIIRGADGGGDFYIAIKPKGGIEWYPRRSVLP